jgi:hypothetical protein
MRRFLKSLFGCHTSVARNKPIRENRTRLECQAMQSREVPAFLSAGTLVINGGTGNDVVTVSNVTVNKVAQVRVVENGVTQDFLRSSVTTGVVKFTGNAGHDTFTNNNARLIADANGGAGNDTLTGNVLADTLTGGTGNDDLGGGGGNDRLLGGSGNDVLSGGSGDDFLNGGTGADVLNGGSGRDGLFGGLSDEADTATGGSGQDRFLDWTGNILALGETRTDVTSGDAVVFFRNDGQQTVPLGSNMGVVTYSAGTWTNAQVESVDKALFTLQKETSNTRLLKTDLGFSLTFHKAGNAPGNPAGGWNSGFGNIVLTNAGADSDANIQVTAIHEVGHNWDTESPFYQQWLSLSGWESNIPGFHDLFPPAGKVRSDDGGWWRNANAQFARNYGKMNPMEDWSTSWEAFFNMGGSRVASKMTHIQMFMDHIQGLS